MGAFYPAPDSWWKIGPAPYRGRTLAQWVQSLFASSDGALLVISPDTCFQDAGGTTPAEVGDPVGLLLDSSGRANNASQATDASRPTLRQDGNGYFYLEHVATRFLDLPVLLTSFDYAAAFGVWYSSGNAQKVPISHRNSGGAAPTIGQIDRQNEQYGVMNRNDAGGARNLDDAASDPEELALQSAWSLAGGALALRIDGVTVASGANPDAPVTVDRARLGCNAFDGAAPMIGRIYSGLALNARVTEAQMVLIERYVGSLCGIAL